MPEPHLRASDSDRTAVATALGEHMAAGRLTLAEYEERLTHVYETKTLGGLAALTADLPPTAATAAPAPRPTVPPAPAGSTSVCGSHGWNGWAGDVHAWYAWRRTAIIVLVIWAATSLANWQFIYFWPVWVIGPWGAVLLAQSLSGRGAPRGRRQRDRRPRDRRQRDHKHGDTGEMQRIRA
jgi:hypothetical protein